MNTKPTPIALVVCDNIYQEPGGKTALVGLFNSINARKLPVRHARMVVFASVTDLRPGSKARLEIVHGESERVVVRVEGPFPKEADPVSVVDFNFVLNNLVFEEDGTHYIRFWVNDYLIVMRPFEVRVIPERKEQHGQ